jgi:glycosyltransferase involved in cell wall biosynthesis
MTVRLYGVSMVRNEADIVRVNVLYHLSLGFDRLLILDNASTDGTRRELRRLGRDHRVRWMRDRGPFRQGEVFTELARQAFSEGADWVAPVDADDFWYSRRSSLKQVLAESGAAALRVRHVDFIQRREQRESSPDELLYMIRRVSEPVDRALAPELLAAGKVSYIEMARLQKLISLASEAVKMVKGAHSLHGVEGPVRETDKLILLHAPLRSLAHLESRAASADRRFGTGASLGPGWHARRWQRLMEEGVLEREWAANSYADDGCLDVYGDPHETVFDPTLRNAVAPFLERSPTRPSWKKFVGRR